MIMSIEGKYNPDGSWTAAEGVPFRSLTTEEVQDIIHMAKTTIPAFGGPHDATWEQHHPIAREIWGPDLNPNSK